MQSFKDTRNFIILRPKKMVTLIHFVLGGPRLVEPLRSNIFTTVGNDINLHCYAEADEMLDIAYIWKHNGLTIRDVDVKNSYNRLVSL